MKWIITVTVIFIALLLIFSDPTIDCNKLGAEIEGSQIVNNQASLPQALQIKNQFINLCMEKSK